MSSATMSTPGLNPLLPFRFKKEKDKKANGLLTLAPDFSCGLNSSYSNQTPPTCQEKRNLAFFFLIRLVKQNIE